MSDMITGIPKMKQTELRVMVVHTICSRSVKLTVDALHGFKCSRQVHGKEIYRGLLNIQKIQLVQELHNMAFK